MLIYISTDHRGYKLKENLKAYLKENGYEVVDLGNKKYDENDDYPDFAEKVASRVNRDYVNGRGVVGVVEPSHVTVTLAPDSDISEGEQEALNTVEAVTEAGREVPPSPVQVMV